MPDSNNRFYKKAPPDRGASSFIYPPTPGNIRFFAEALKAGCLVAIPTETVYGLAGLALDPTACRSIFALKGRPLIDPLIVHVSDLSMADSLAVLTPEVENLAAQFWPGPLTLILKKKPVVPDIVTAGMQTVAIRMPRHPVTRHLLEELSRPLAAPSANPFGYISPSEARHVADSFAGKVPFILDGGQSEIGLESTIVDLTDLTGVKILRPGAISSKDLSNALQRPVEYLQRPEGDESSQPAAPGMLSRHYSPKTRLILFPEGNPPPTAGGEAVIALKAGEESRDQADCFWFSERGDPAEIARNLFALLRQVDRSGYDRIHCELPAEPASGLLLAIRDRLTRASSQK